MIKEETSTKGYQKDTQGRAHVGRLWSEYGFYSMEREIQSKILSKDLIQFVVHFFESCWKEKNKHCILMHICGI